MKSSANHLSPISLSPATVKAVESLKVPELKAALSECFLPLKGNKTELVGRFTWFAGYLSEHELNCLIGFSRRNLPVTGERIRLPYSLGPVSIVYPGRGGTAGSEANQIPIGFESIRRYPLAEKHVATLHFVRTHAAAQYINELEAEVVNQVSVVTLSGVRTFQSSDLSAAYYTALKAFVEGLKVPEDDKKKMMRQVVSITTRSLGLRLVGLDEGPIGAHVRQVLENIRLHGFEKGEPAHLKCLEPFFHITRLIRPKAAGGPPGASHPHPSASFGFGAARGPAMNFDKNSLPPWAQQAAGMHQSLPVRMPSYTKPAELPKAVKDILEEFFPLWECKDDSVLLPPMPLEERTHSFFLNESLSANQKVFFVFLKQSGSGYELEGYMNKLKVHLNSCILSIPPKFERVEITKQIEPGRNVLRVDLPILTTARSMHYFTVLKLFPRSVDNLLDSIKTSQSVSSAEAVERLQQYLGPEDDEFAADSVTVKVTCPISRLRLTTPARGRACQHVQCFDLRNFLTVFENSRHQRRCTVCAKPIPAIRDLIVDTLMVQILEAIKDDEDVLSVVLQRDGSWRVAQREGGSSKPQAPCSVKEESPKSHIKAEDVIDDIQSDHNEQQVKRALDEEDEEVTAKRQKTTEDSPSHEKEKGAAEPPDVIVISDSEDEDGEEERRSQLPADKGLFSSHFVTPNPDDFVSGRQGNRSPVSAARGGAESFLSSSSSYGKDRRPSMGLSRGFDLHGSGEEDPGLRLDGYFSDTFSYPYLD